MKYLGTVFWWAILLASATALGAGYASGRATSAAALEPRQRLGIDVPAPMQPRASTERILFGAHSLQAADADDPPPAIEVAVARPPGWAPTVPPGAVRSRSRLALILYDAGRAAALDARFAALDVPLAFAIDPGADQAAESAQAARQGGKTVLAAVPAAVVASRDEGALAAWIRQAVRLAPAGVLGPLSAAPDPGAVRQLAQAARAQHWYVVDGVPPGGAALYAQARAFDVKAATRDYVLDRYGDQAYMRFMLRSAGELAQRTGVAIALMRPTLEAYQALSGEVPGLARAGVDLVDPGTLAQ